MLCDANGVHGEFDVVALIGASARCRLSRADFRCSGTVALMGGTFLGYCFSSAIYGCRVLWGGYSCSWDWWTWLLAELCSPSEVRISFGAYT